MNINKIIEWLDSEEGQRTLSEYAEKSRRELQHQDRWEDRVWERIKENVDGWIQRGIDWYDSEKYRDREYKMGVEPREELLWVLLGIAEKHGNECTEEEINKFANPFTGSIQRLGSYVIQSMHGQGSVIKIDKL